MNQHFNSNNSQSSNNKLMVDGVLSLDKDVDRDEYFKFLAQEYQKTIVNHTNASTSSNSIYVWTYRNTGCDVISVVTTATPIQNGDMKDIKIFNKEMRRIKPPANKGAIKESRPSPLEETQGVLSIDITKKKMSTLLKNEKKAFLNRLHISRYIRTTIENQSCVIIQKYYRRFSTRNNFNKIIDECTTRKTVRTAMKEYLQKEHGDVASKIISNLGSHRNNYKSHRTLYIIIIQCAFRRFISRRCLRMRRMNYLFYRRRSSAIRIQCMARKVSAKKAVMLVCERMSVAKKYLSAVKIQCAIRKLSAKRQVLRRRIKLRYIAARIIQSYYRTQYSKRLIVGIKLAMKEAKLSSCILGMQCLVRRFIAIRRVNRIRFRRMHLLIFKSASSIQSAIRYFNARKRVKRIRMDIKTTIAAATKVSNDDKQRENRCIAEELLNKSDIFLQVMNGNYDNVHAILQRYCNKQVDGKTIEQVILETNFNGDTVLSIAASVGNADIVKECIELGFDHAHRNNNGDTPLLLAVCNNHKQVVSYLLSPELHLQFNHTDDDYARLLVNAISSSTDHDILSLLLSSNMNVNTKLKASGITPFHKACVVGNIEAMHLLHKAKCSIDDLDYTDRSPLMKTCMVSLKAVKLLLGIEQGLGVYMKPDEQVKELLATDSNGKDCYIIAALYGQSKVMDLITGILKSGSSERSSRAGGAITWNASDVAQVFNLVTSNNRVCLHTVLDAGFDTNHKHEQTGCTLAMQAARCGNTDIIDLLMERQILLSKATDLKGMTLLHHAAACTSKSMVAYLLSHTHAIKCMVNEMGLAVSDRVGNTPLHIAAIEGVIVHVDLLARNGLEAGLKMKNNDGMTPLLLACSHSIDSIVKLYIHLGADTKVVDNNGLNCLWHLYHPHASVKERKPCIIASEYVAIKSTAAVTKKMDRDADVHRLAADVDLVIHILKAGCPLYSTYNIATTITNDFVSRSVYGVNDTVDRARNDRTVYEAGDILVQECSYTLIKALADVLTHNDLWRLVLSCIKYDNIAKCKALMTLFESGIAAKKIINKVDVIPRYVVNNMDNNAAVAAVINGTTNTTNTATCFSGIEDIFYKNITLAGWVIMFNRGQVLKSISKRGLSLNSYADNEGNSCLHYACRYGTPSIIDTIISSDESIRLEQVNKEGYTPMVLCAIFSKLENCKSLIKLGVNPRSALAYRYSSWMLAFTRKMERQHKLILWGRFGDDDVKYFPSNDPIFIE